MKKKQLYLKIFISPIGLDRVNFTILDKKPNPREDTNGEGQCFVFRMVDGDFSTNFFKALQDGTIMNEFGNKRFEINLNKIFAEYN